MSAALRRPRDQGLPLRLITITVLIATLGGALLGFGSGQRFRAEAVFSISRLEGADASRPELQRIAEDLVVVSKLPSVRQEVRQRVGLLPSAEFEPDVGLHEEADGVVRFSATHADAETARQLALTLATVSVEFLVDGRARPAEDYVTLAERSATDSVLEGQSLVTADDTVAVSLWPAFARSAVVAAVASVSSAVILLGASRAVGNRRADRSVGVRADTPSANHSHRLEGNLT